MTPRDTERIRDDCVVTPGASEGTRGGKRERLGVELRRARELAGLSGRQLAQRIGISQSKVSRAESGSALLSLPEAAAWASATGASNEVTDLLSALTEAVYTEVHNWGSLLEERPHIQGDIQGLESRARRVLTFSPSLVPGILQTAEYARRVFAMFQPPYLEQDIPEVLAARLDRQLALFAGRQRFEFLITEAALRWRPGPPALLLAQLDRIASLSTLDNVSTGVIPLDVEAVAYTSHTFLLFEMAEREEGDATVLVETIHANLVVNDPQSIALYRTRWSLLEQMAISGDAARDFLTAIGSDIRKSMTLIRAVASRRGAGDAARAGALHPPGIPGGSVEVELARLDRADELRPFGDGVPENGAVRILRVAHGNEFQLADFHARTPALAGPGEGNHFFQRVPVHRTSLSASRRGVSAPSMRKASRGHLERDLHRGLGGFCSFPIPRTGRIRGLRQPARLIPGVRPTGGHHSCASAC
jgi:transcriptional regulator with XRE-family HTH domain